MSAGSLTYEELVVACANIGYDLTCGACAARFYTGVVLERDTHTCDDRGLTDGIDRTLRIHGEEASFRCTCGCNVFRTLRMDKMKFKCNACGAIYTGEE